MGHPPPFDRADDPRRRVPRRTAAGAASSSFKARFGLLALGAIWGLVVPLSSLASRFGAGPFGLTGWVSAISATICLTIALRRRTIVLPTPAAAVFFLAWALLGTVIPQALLFWVAGRIASSTISVIVILEGFIVFALAAALRLEAPTARRFAGLALGFVGLIPVLASTVAAPDQSLTLTLLAVLGLPICYATENLLIAACKPPEIDPIAGIALMQGMGAAIAFGIAFFCEDFLWLAVPAGRLEAVVLALGLCAALANYLFQSLIASSGSVFTSQCSYLITLAGLGWSVLLLGETISPWIGGSVATIFLGILLVTPKAPAVAAAPGRPSSLPFDSMEIQMGAGGLPGDGGSDLRGSAVAETGSRRDRPR
ncbi:ABC transporter permease [Aureimonas endophytica]|uniref:ABC transporter permease n=1 Tax=Aureimonas endophytica TaxID=2027858 RepID=A0A917E1D5_9HYPH|nr:DMT family transporter [Aureimonas endophytica]GGD91851.1 ABC transporter permease [Aureimonas endophytica]